MGMTQFVLEPELVLLGQTRQAGTITWTPWQAE